jgi:hypothetical protein
MVSKALATRELVTLDDVQPAFPAVHPEGHTALCTAAEPWLQPGSASCSVGQR